MHNAVPYDRKMGTGLNHGDRPYHPVMPEFIKSELSMHDTLQCAVVALISGETDGG